MKSFTVLLGFLCLINYSIKDVAGNYDRPVKHQCGYRKFSLYSVDRHFSLSKRIFHVIAADFLQKLLSL